MQLPVIKCDRWESMQNYAERVVEHTVPVSHNRKRARIRTAMLTAMLNESPCEPMELKPGMHVIGRRMYKAGTSKYFDDIPMLGLYKITRVTSKRVYVNDNNGWLLLENVVAVVSDDENE